MFLPDLPILCSHLARPALRTRMAGYFAKILEKLNEGAATPVFQCGAPAAVLLTDSRTHEARLVLLCGYRRQQNSSEGFVLELSLQCSPVLGSGLGFELVWRHHASLEISKLPNDEGFEVVWCPDDSFEVREFLRGYPTTAPTPEQPQAETTWLGLENANHVASAVSGMLLSDQALDMWLETRLSHVLDSWDQELAEKLYAPVRATANGMEVRHVTRLLVKLLGDTAVARLNDYWDTLRPALAQLGFVLVDKTSDTMFMTDVTALGNGIQTCSATYRVVESETPTEWATSVARGHLTWSLKWDRKTHECLLRLQLLFRTMRGHEKRIAREWTYPLVSLDFNALAQPDILEKMTAWRDSFLLDADVQEEAAALVSSILELCAP